MNDMVKTYCVAGHTFQLSMPDGSPLWQCLSQYSPFEVIAVAEPLFILHVVDSLPETVRTPLLEETPEEPGSTRLSLFSIPEGLCVEMAPCFGAPVCGTLMLDKDYKIGKLKIEPGTRELSLFALNNSMMLFYAFATAGKMTLEMHSSVVIKDGKGYMFLGKSGTGKSTHSSLWLRYVPGSELLNDDNPIIHIAEDGVAMVYGSPWSGKTPCYRNVSVPIGAIVRIVRADHNAISRYGILESYTSVYSSCSGFKADRGIADGLHKTLEHVALNVPCYKLECLPDRDAAIVCSDQVIKK